MTKTAASQKAYPLHRPVLHVLLVDDDPVFRKTFERLGLEMDVAVTSCGSLRELGVLALPDVFDVAVVDYYLDGVKSCLTGTAVANYLGKTPVILVSRSKECEDMDLWPSNIKKFLAKEAGPETILEEALHLKSIVH